MKEVGKSGVKKNSLLKNKLKNLRFYTVGHSTRSSEEFLSTLKAFGIEALVDIRAFPVSRRNPQFNKENLEKSLARDKIRYLWLGTELGGYRKKSDGLGEESLNKGWGREGFRIYADYMMSDNFKSAACKLVELAKKKRVAYMCAEKFYWRCHRRLVSDYLCSLGHEVWHIVEQNILRRHELTSFAQVRNGRLTYPQGNASAANPSLFKE